MFPVSYKDISTGRNVNTTLDEIKEFHSGDLFFNISSQSQMETIINFIQMKSGRKVHYTYWANPLRMAISIF